VALQQAEAFTMATPDGPIFRRAAGIDKPALPHPTNAAFDDEIWDKALKALPNPTEDDYRLAVAAGFLAPQFAAVRHHIGEQLNGLSKASSVQLIAALSNRQYCLAAAKAGKAARRAGRDGPQHMDMLVDLQIYSGPTLNQTSNVDSIIETVVDTFPHAYFYALKRPDTETTVPEQELVLRALNLGSASSLERSLRYLWQDCLWNGRVPEPVGDAFEFRPLDAEDQERWQAWVIREQSLQTQESFAHGLMFGGEEEPTVERAVTRTIVGFDQRPGQKYRPIIVRSKRWSSRQRANAMRWLGLSRSYLAPFMDVPLENADGPLSIRTLLKAWWVLSELCDVLLADLPAINKLASREAMRKQALGVKRTLLVDVLCRALEVDDTVATAIIEFLLVQTKDISRLFNRSLWGNPLLTAPNGEKLYLIAPVLAAGNPIRAAEYWLEQGGVSNSLQLRGSQFETTCRDTLHASLADNSLLADWDCPLAGLPTADDGEEIDALIRIGNTVLVIEAKCLLTPTEPIERYNFIKRLNDGCEQVKRKSDWFSRNRIIATQHFHCSKEEADKLRFFPLVVTNQSFGLGHSFAEVPVVDLKYLDLICAGGSYISDAAFKTASRASVGHKEKLYDDAQDLEKRIARLLRDPVVMRRFKNRFVWQRQPIPSATTKKIFGLIPVLIEAPTALPSSAPLLQELQRKTERD
jgi:hypothetical protein